jgi:hypothetical protein
VQLKDVDLKEILSTKAGQNQVGDSGYETE